MNVHNRLSRFQLLLFSAILLGLLVAPALIRSGSMNLDPNSHSMPAQDDYGPAIFDWGIVGFVGSDSTVTTWANVSDSDPGLLNVSFVVVIDHIDITKTLMTSNGSFYVLDTDMFTEDHYYKVWIESFDNELNYTVSGFRTFNLYDDTFRPNIHVWGINGVPLGDETFTVWANVSDANSGVLNVTALVWSDLQPHSLGLMTFNGSYYTTELTQVGVNHTYIIRVEAYDNALNKAESYEKNFDYSFDRLNRPDTWLTFPIVVPVSLAVFGIVVTVACIKYKRDERHDASVPIEVPKKIEDEPEETRPHILDELERDR